MRPSSNASAELSLYESCDASRQVLGLPLRLGLREDADDRLGARRADEDAADSPERWATQDGTSAGIRLFSEDNPDRVWQWIMFNQPDKALYVVILEWEGHTHAELDDAWFSQAPFTGPAGT